MHRARAIFEEEFHAFSLKISGIVTTVYLKSFVVTVPSEKKKTFNVM